MTLRLKATDNPPYRYYSDSETIAPGSEIASRSETAPTSALRGLWQHRNTFYPRANVRNYIANYKL